MRLPAAHSKPCASKCTEAVFSSRFRFQSMRGLLTEYSDHKRPSASVSQEPFDHPSELLGSLARRRVPQRPEDPEDEATSKQPVKPLQLGEREPAHDTGLHPLRRGSGEPRI